MATKILYTYKINKNELFMIKTSSKVRIDRHETNFKIEDIDSLLDFVYNSEYSILHSLDTIQDLTLEEAFKLGTIYIETYTKYSKEEINKIYQIDWGQTITDLESQGLIKTKPTTSFMAIDSRKYWITDETTAIDVDCLGTTLFLEESQMIIDMWKKLE